MPDLLVIHVSAATVRRLVHNNLRLMTPREAVLASRLTDGDVPSRRHDREAAATLVERGWGTRATRLPRIVDAIAIEVKVRDWRAGLHQLDRYMRWSSRGLLAAPPEVIARIPQRYRDSSGVGLAAVKSGSTRLIRKGRRKKLTIAATLWMAELCARQYEAS